MSREALTTIVSRAITDSDYRVQLLNNPDAALKDYDLSEQEEKMIRNLNSDTFDAMTLDLEARQSKSGFLGSISLMGGKDSVDMDSILNLMMNKYGGESWGYSRLCDPRSGATGKKRRARHHVTASFRSWGRRAGPGASAASCATS